MNAVELRAGAARAALFGVAMLLSFDARAKTTGVVEDPILQSGPCYDALVDKNAANPTTAPKRELGSACEAEHGDIDKAWARVIRLWGSDSTEVPDYDSYRRADAPADGAAPKWLGWAGLLLAYAALGAPMRSAARLARAYPGPATGAPVDVFVCLLLRGSIVAIWAALFSFPYLAALGGGALITWILLARPRAAPARTAAPASRAPGALSRRGAEAINDAAGAAAGLAAAALFARGDWTLIGVALALALVVSAGPVIAARRALRATRMGAAAVAAMLAAALGETLVLTPPISGWAAGLTGAYVVAPLALATLTLAAGWRAGIRPARLARG